MTLHLDDARWRTATTARLVDEPHGVDPAWLDEYAPHDAEIAAEKALLDALSEPDPAVRIDDEAVIAGALEQWEPPGLAAAKPRGHWVARVAVVTGVLAAGIAAGLLLSTGPRAPEGNAGDDELARAGAVTTSPAEHPTEAPSPAPAPDELPQRSAPEETPQAPAAWTVRSGQVIAQAEDAAAPLPRGVALIAAGRLCTFSTPSNEICLDDGSRFELVQGDRLELQQGTARVHVDEGHAPSVTVGDMRIEAEGLTTYVIEYETAGWSLTVEQGAPVMHAQQTHTTVQAGQTLSGKTERTRARRPTPDPRARLAAARAMRAAGDREGAAKIYEALIASSPRSPLARVATVSLGQLYLELGRPKKARAAFERYLARGAGTLSEDAAFGRLRALRALDSPALGPATQKFLARYPDGAYAPRVRRWSD